MINIDYNKIYSTKSYGNFIIIDNLGYQDNAGTKRLWIRIKFLTTGYEKNIRYDYLNHDIVDPYYPRIYGIGCIGEIDVPRIEYKADYDRWIHMLDRCYNITSKDYRNYGALGVLVDPSWFNFTTYFHDLKSLPNYNLKVLNPNMYCLDKDLLQYHLPKNKRIYSKYTCMWITKSLNSIIANGLITVADIIE